MLDKQSPVEAFFCPIYSSIPQCDQQPCYDQHPKTSVFSHINMVYGLTNLFSSTPGPMGF